MFKVIMGIDPGANGSIAIITDTESYAHKIPETPKDLFELLVKEFTLHFGSTIKCYIEAVHSMPGNAGSRMLTYGIGFGHLEMGLISLGIPYERVRATVWQKGIGMLSRKGKKDKNVNKAKAQELFPNINITHAIADGLLIAEYGRRLNSKTSPSEYNASLPDPQSLLHVSEAPSERPESIARKTLTDSLPLLRKGPSF